MTYQHTLTGKKIKIIVDKSYTHNFKTDHAYWEKYTIYKGVCIRCGFISWLMPYGWKKYMYKKERSEIRGNTKNIME